MFSITKSTVFKFGHSKAIICCFFGYELHGFLKGLLNDDRKKVGKWKSLLGSFLYSVPVEAMEVHVPPYKRGMEEHS